jgi:molybdopterin molybdotransferase
MTLKLIDDCFVHDRDRLRHDDALALLRARVTTVTGHETVPLAEAHGRVLATPVIADVAVPAHTNAAVDGYSFAHADAARAASEGLPISGRSAAGHPMADTPARQSAVRIFTGAVVPTGHDTIAMQEDCVRGAAPDGVPHVKIPAGLKRGANVRQAGEDVQSGATLIVAGTRLRPQDVAALASIGRAEVKVHSRLKVAVLSSGDEVVMPGKPLLPGQVYDANSVMLQGLVTAAGASFTPLGIVGDTPSAVDAQLADAARRFDVILTSGGASQGEEDHITSALDRLGKRHLWQLAIKPGRPMSFGQIGDCVVVGLPGNPVAVFVCFLMYVLPVLGALGGAGWRAPRPVLLPAAFELKSRKTGRREFWRGSYAHWNGKTAVTKFDRDGSGLISGLRAADGLIDVVEDTPAIQPGDQVRFLPFSEFGLSTR